jgi:benzil reductase ((S)-benzoin forming)
MTMEAYIITGASKGIGNALSRQLTDKGHQVYGIARSFSEDWPGTKPFEFDLLNTSDIPELMGRIFDLISGDVTSLTLINNAGTISPIGFAENNQAAEVRNSITLNLTAPMITSGAFISLAADFASQKRIINISSGAGRKAYEGWSSYCAGKAGLDHFSLCLAEEYKDIKTMSIAPGIIDTGMQEKIRESSEIDFPMIENFKMYKEQGMLSTPDQTAEQLIRLLEREDFKVLETIADIRDYV